MIPPSTYLQFYNDTITNLVETVVLVHISVLCKRYIFLLFLLFQFRFLNPHMFNCRKNVLHVNCVNFFER